MDADYISLYFNNVILVYLFLQLYEQRDTNEIETSLEVEIKPFWICLNIMTKKLYYQNYLQAPFERKLIKTVTWK